MSATVGAQSSSPRIPQPGSTPEELRAAVALLVPDALATFDAERIAALKQARENVTAAPMRRFVGQWAVYVAIERHPQRAARLRDLEAAANEADGLDQARAIAAEIGRILDAACTEAGIPHGEAARRAMRTDEGEPACV